MDEKEKKMFKSGKLEILNKGIKFQEKKKNPFGEKVEMVIPTKEITYYAHKIFEDGENGIEIGTSVGPIFFMSEELHDI